jgi:tRNA pseudouridine13 synthase
VIRIRTTPEDFRVDEQPLYPASGAGAHTFVRVEKRERTTEAVARDLARVAGARPQDVGYAGRKDRAAVATQWLSVPNLDPDAALALDLPGVRVLEAVRHPHKLRTGHLRGNRFAIRIHGVDAAARACAEVRRAEIERRGLPNRFGDQRFGRSGDNAERARRFCAGELRVRDRRDARFLVSAWQAEVFNAVLTARPVPLDELEAGDLAIRHDSGGVFAVSDPACERERVRAFEISATGPVFGPRMTWPAGIVALRERAVMSDHGLDPDALRLPGVRARGARRALRVRPDALTLEGDGESLLLRCDLPAGSYATVLVEELFGPVDDASIRERSEGAGRDRTDIRP